MKREDKEKVLYLIMEMSVQLIKAGAEVYRVEDTIKRMGEAYGAFRMNVFAITSSIVVTAEFPDGDTITQSRRIWGTPTTDFTKIEDINRLSRQCCSSPLSPSALEDAIKAIKKERYPLLLTLLGSALSAFAFTLFFGGTLLDGFVSLVSAVVLVYLVIGFGKVSPNRFASQIVVSFLIGLLVQVVGLVVPSVDVDMVLIGNIMLLIPGLALTNSVKDILLGDTISGVLRLIEAVLLAVGLALGFILSMLLVGGLA